MLLRTLVRPSWAAACAGAGRTGEGSGVLAWDSIGQAFQSRQN